MRRPRSLRAELPKGDEVPPASHQGECHEIDTPLEAETEIRPVLLRDRRQLEPAGGQVDADSRTKRTAVFRPAEDNVAFEGLDPQLDRAVAQQNAVALRDAVAETFVVDGERVAATARPVNQADPIAVGERRRSSFTSAKLRSAKILQDPDDLSEIASCGPNRFQSARVFVVRPMREVQSRHVHAGRDQGADCPRSIGRRAERADDFRAAHPVAYHCQVRGDSQGNDSIHSRLRSRKRVTRERELYLPEEASRLHSPRRHWTWIFGTFSSTRTDARLASAP